MSYDGTALSTWNRLHLYFLNDNTAHTNHLCGKYRMLKESTVSVAKYG